MKSNPISTDTWVGVFRSTIITTKTKRKQIVLNNYPTAATWIIRCRLVNLSNQKNLWWRVHNTLSNNLCHLIKDLCTHYNINTEKYVKDSIDELLIKWCLKAIYIGNKYFFVFLRRSIFQGFYSLNRNAKN